MKILAKAGMPKGKHMERPRMLSTRAIRGHGRQHSQRGVVMVIALIFLLLLTILAVSASGNSLLQERMSGGLRNAQQAQMSAETALRGAEQRHGWRASALWHRRSRRMLHLRCCQPHCSRRQISHAGRMGYQWGYHIQSGEQRGGLHRACQRQIGRKSAVYD
jgi:hypothetical protein